MRNDHFAGPMVLNLVAMLSISAPVALVFTGAGLHMGISGQAITLSAGLWSAIVCRVAANAFDPSRRAPERTESARRPGAGALGVAFALTTRDARACIEE